MAKISKKKIVLFALVPLVVILAVGVFAYYKFENQKYDVNEAGEYTAEDSSLTGEDIAKNSDADQTNSEKNLGSPQKSIDNTTSSTTLTTPSGNFVSSHTVKPDSTIESVCVTTPGAQCKIVLSMGGTTKTLNEKTTDIYGVASWLWQPKKIGINNGSWQIKAIASRNGETKESVDAMNLEII